jgi:hypothetical protein
LLRREKFHLTIAHLWGITAIVGIFIFVSTHPIRPYDFWWHITIGREILSAGKIPTSDIYSYTAAGQPYPSYQMFWLMELAMYSVYRLGGPALVIFLHSLVITSAYVVLFWVCKEASKSWRIAAFGVLFAAALGLNDWNVRPQGITFLLASMILLAIQQYKKSGRRGWLLVFPLSMLIWANSHGTFVIGLILIGIWLAQEVWEAVRARFIDKRAVDTWQVLTPGLVLIVSGLVCFINPRGIGIVNYVLTLTGNSAVQNLVTEWAAPTFNTLMGTLFLVGLLASAVLMILSPRRPKFYEMITFLIFGLLGLKTLRGSVWYGLVMAPILSRHLALLVDSLQRSEKAPARTEGSKILNYTFVFVLVLVSIVSLPWFKSSLPMPALKAGLISSETPVKATQVLLQENPPGQLFNGMSFGSYLIWAAYPQYQVFADSRIELFSEKVWRDYLSISNAEGDWEKLLSDYGVNTLMLSPTEQAGLIRAASASGNWTLQYQDPSAVIFTRK